MRTFIAGWSDAILARLEKLDWLAPLVVRLFFGYFWAETGWGKLHNLDAATMRFVDWGIPWPQFSAAFSAAAEFLGGAFLMAGLLTRLTSLALLINMVVAIAFVVIKHVEGFDDFVELDEFTYILVFFWFIMAGPGKASADTIVARWLGLSGRPR